MNKSIKRLIVLSVMFLGVSSSIYACPAGMVELPGGVCLPPDHQNSPLNNLPSASPPPPVWATRWGAIASDGNGVFGIVNDMPSKRKAQNAAIAACKSQGGGGCIVKREYYNQCAAVVLSETRSAYANAPTKEEALEIGKQDCAATNTGECWVHYSGCSMPVRVN